MEKFFKYPWIIVSVIAVITVFFALQLPRIELDNNILAVLPDDNPARKAAKHLEAEYGDNAVIMVGLERRYGTIFDRAFLFRIKEFTEAVQEIEFVKNTTSVMSTRYITADSESITVTDLAGDDFLGTEDEIAELKRRLASWDLYQGSLVSEDLSSTRIVVRLDVKSDDSGKPEVTASLRKIRELAKEMFKEFAEVYTAGQPVAAATLSEAVHTDVYILVPLVIIVTLFVLVLSFRRFTYVYLPLLTVIVAVIWAVGAMPLFGIKLTILCSVLPVILIAVGSAYGIHIVSHYKDGIRGKTFTAGEHRTFILNLTRKLAKPVFLASLTTFAGFISFCFAPLEPTRNFGIFASFGVLVAFAAALTLVPAILIIRGPSCGKISGGSTKDAAKKIEFNFQTGLENTLSAAANKKIPVLVITALVIIVSFAGIPKIVVDNAMVEFFNDDSEVSRSDRFIREQFGGSSQLVVSVEADSPEILLSPETLSAADGICAYLIECVPEAGKVTGFTDMVKRINQMFNADEPPEGVRISTQIARADSGSADFGFGNFGSYESEEEVPISRPDYTNLPAVDDTSLTFAMLNAAAKKHANMSANSLVRELERITNYRGYAYYEIPADPARYGKQNSEELERLIANYLVLLAGDSDDLLSNDPLEPTAIKIMIQIKSQWQRDMQKVTDAVEGYIAANFPDKVRIVIGGGAAQEKAVSGLVMHSQMISIVLSVLFVLVIAALSNKSLAAGFIAALPLAAAITANFAVMGFLHINLNMGTSLIASISVGIGIDYTIHFIEFFKREYEAGGDFLRRTFATSGKAILINAVSVGAGFGVLSFSSFRILAQLGILITLSMAISAAVSLTVIPVLLTTIKPKFIYGKPGQSASSLILQDKDKE